MIKKKIKLYYKKIVSKTFENIHGKVFLKRNIYNHIDITRVNDTFLKYGHFSDSLRDGSRGGPGGPSPPPPKKKNFRKQSELFPS